MPLQLIVYVFLATAFVAIVWRFMPRADDGSMRLPTLIDESVGMWLVRRALGRTGDADRPAEDEAPPDPLRNEIANGTVAPGSPMPTLPTRFVVSSASFRAQPTTPTQAAPGRLASVERPPVYAARPRRPSGALAAQRRTAGAVALAVVAIAVTIVALGTRQLGGEVLSATGTPAGSGGGGFIGGPADASPDGSGEPSSSLAP
jgi:hypothetical protein